MPAFMLPFSLLNSIKIENNTNQLGVADVTDKHRYFRLDGLIVKHPWDMSVESNFTFDLIFQRHEDSESKRCLLCLRGFLGEGEIC